MARFKTVPIAEIFGPTIQGEGALAGMPTYFVRVGGCDYECAWCDSAHAVLAENVRGLPKLSQEQIFEQVSNLPKGPKWLTISGGNPALYDLTELVALWQASGGEVAVETQGSKWQRWLFRTDLLTVSPKPPSSGLSAFRSLEYLDAFMGERDDTPGEMVNSTHDTVLKVVVFDDADYDFAVEVHSLYPRVPFYLSTGTAMGGLTGTFVPPAYEDTYHDFDKFGQVRKSAEEHGGLEYKQGFIASRWTERAVTDDERSLLNRYRWLADKVKGDPRMKDVAVFPQLHALIWGITSRGV